MYCADTNAFIEGWVRSYPVEVFPRLWVNIERLIKEERFISSDEVKRELERRSDTLLEWATQQDGLFQPLDGDTQEAVTKIMARFPRLVDTRRNRSGADPFVIALAQVRGAIVVTQEQYTNSLEKPKIPDVCDAIEVKHINLLGLIRREKWKF